VTPDFALDHAGLREAPGLVVRGEVDLAAAPELDAAIEDAIRESAGAFVIDLTEVGFIDSTGLQVLLRARALLGREDRALALVCPHGPVRRVFALYPTRAAAAAALVPPTPPPSPARPG
jgi:anti-sigma B factor antagonist